MNFDPSPFMEPQVSVLSLGFAPIAAGLIAATILIFKFCKSSDLDSIPTVGSSNFLESWWAGYKFQSKAIDLIQQGYDKHKSVPFKIADRYRWIVVIGGRQYMEEIRKAPNDALSFFDAASEEIQMEHTMGPELLHNPYHIEIVRSQLTRNLVALYPEIRDEISVAFDETLDLRGNEWKSVPALGVIQQVVCRTSNRMVVGLPLCRNADWLDLNVRYTLSVFQGAKAIRRFPAFLAPVAAHFITDVPETMEQATRQLTPFIEERLELLEKHGKYRTDKPNDFLSWLLDEAPEGPERGARLLTTRILSVNFAAIQTSSNSFTHALFLLAENPQYIQPLREEVESIVEKEGWSKATLGKMHKIDSFLKECQRLAGIGAVSLARKALKDFTFSDGTFIPKGTSIVSPSRCVHLDDEHYDDAHAFDPFRFSRIRDGEGEGAKHQFVSTSPEYLAFGHGKHACPGRFFAATELKTMLAHIVLTYDVKLEDDKHRPQELRMGFDIAANPFANVMFRKRV